jgi:Rrf2 family cysteine metabolism transcriptional repressor
MKISRKVEYASRVLAQLARCHGHGGNRMPHIEELADIEKVPANYLVQILNELRNAGLIADIIRAIDGELLECSTQVAGESGKGVYAVLTAAAKDFETGAQSRTLKDILGAESSEMYFI